MEHDLLSHAALCNIIFRFLRKVRKNKENTDFVCHISTALNIIFRVTHTRAKGYDHVNVRTFDLHLKAILVV